MRVSDVVRAVGRSFESRKAVADALEGYPANGGGSGGGGRGGVETRGGFVVVFVNVGDGKGRRYGNEVWEEESSGRRRHRSEADADADGGDAEDVGKKLEDVGVSSSAGTSSSAAVMMSWFSGTRADGAPRSVSEILRASREADAAEAEDAAGLSNLDKLRRQAAEEHAAIGVRFSRLSVASHCRDTCGG